MEPKQTLAQKIKSLRETHSLSQQEMADTLGMARATFSDIERAVRDVTVTELTALADFFELSVDELLASPPNGVATPNPTSEVEFKSDKLKNVLLYVLERCGGKPNIGETVLYKLLYFIDFDMYDQYGQSVTGLTYVNQKFGPVPLQTQYKEVVINMQEQDELKIFSQDYFGLKQKRFVALKNHAAETFTEREKNVIDAVIARLSDMGARQIEAYVHEDVPWKATENKEVIPYNLVFERTVPFSRRDHRADMQTAAADAILKKLGPISDEEFNYYMNK